MNTGTTSQGVFEAQRVQDIIGPHEGTIAECWFYAMDAWNEHSRNMPDVHPLLGPGTRGVYMHDLAVAHAKKLFAGTDVQNIQFRQVELFDFGQGLFLRFKQPGCPDTQTAKGLANQLWLIPEIGQADPDCQTIVEVEYTLDWSGTQIARVCIACMIDTRKKWSYPIYPAADVHTRKLRTEEQEPRTKTRVRPLEKPKHAN